MKWKINKDTKMLCPIPEMEDPKDVCLDYNTAEKAWSDWNNYLASLPAPILFIGEVDGLPDELKEDVHFFIYKAKWYEKTDKWYECDECCNGDRCDEPRHLSRSKCPYCKGTGSFTNELFAKRIVAYPVQKHPEPVGNTEQLSKESETQEELWMKVTEMILSDNWSHSELKRLFTISKK